MPKNLLKLVHPKNTKKPQKSAPGRENPTWCCPILFAHFRLWVTVWVMGKTKEFKRIFQLQKQRKVPDFLRNQELFGGDYWTRTSDLLRVKIRQVRKERAIPSFPPLLAQNHLLSAPLFPLSPAYSNSRLGHGLGQATRMNSKMVQCIPHRGNADDTVGIDIEIPDALDDTPGNGWVY